LRGENIIMSKAKVVAVNGSPSNPSRTLGLTRSITDALATHVDADVEIVEIAQVGTAFGAALGRKQLDEGLEAIIRRIEGADILVAATPVYRGTYTGLFKHVFDLVHHDALADVPVILAATGGSDRHALVIDHALRPLFSFFRAHPVATGVYATESNFKGDHVIDVELARRIELAAQQAARAHTLRSHFVPPASAPKHARAS
jgi:FMN reductase